MDVIDLSDDETPCQPAPKKLKTENVIVLSDDDTEVLDLDNVGTQNETNGTNNNFTEKIVGTDEIEIKNNNMVKNVNGNSIQEIPENSDEIEDKENSKEDVNKEIESSKTEVKGNNEKGTNDDELLVVLKEEPYKPEPAPSKPIQPTTIQERKELPSELDEFINICKENLPKNTSQIKLDRKLKTIRRTAQKASFYIHSEDFHAELKKLQFTVDREPIKSESSLIELYHLLKSKSDPETSADEKDNAKNAAILDNLYEKLAKVKERIKLHETEEVDFEKDDNSSYIKYSTYQEKAAEILAAIARLEKHSQYDGQAYFSRLNFDKSTIDEFNVALNKKYRNRENHSFPTFGEVDKCLRKCVKKHNLDISETTLKTEVVTCLKELGKLLKKRGQKDLRSLHQQYLTDFQDPAANSPELERKLRENRKHAKSTLDALLEKFVGLQEANVEPELSEDSDDSECHTESEED